MTFAKGYIPWNKSKPNSEEHNSNIGKSLKERYKTVTHHLTGTKRSVETRLKLSIARTNEKNPAWKGDKVGYRGIHKWIERKLGKANKCSFDPTHQSVRFDWANISGSYLRDLEDWSQLCRKCHRQYDMIRRGRVYL